MQCSQGEVPSMTCLLIRMLIVQRYLSGLIATEGFAILIASREWLAYLAILDIDLM